jgi:hypothetical protein
MQERQGPSGNKMNKIIRENKPDKIKATPITEYVNNYRYNLVAIRKKNGQSQDS